MRRVFESSSGRSSGYKKMPILLEGSGLGPPGMKLKGLDRELMITSLLGGKAHPARTAGPMIKPYCSENLHFGLHFASLAFSCPRQNSNLNMRPFFMTNDNQTGA